MRNPWIPARGPVTEGFDSFAKLARFGAPVLLMRIGANTPVPAASGRVLAAARPDARLVVAPRIGHDIVWQPAAQRTITAWSTHTVAPARDGR